MKKRRVQSGRHVGWDDELWERRFAELVEYRENHGDTLVPARWRKNASLGRWLAHQRELQRRGGIESERAARLEKLGVKWSLKQWHSPDDDEHVAEMLARLADHQERYGEAAVSRETDAPLTRWIEGIRRSLREARMTKARQEQLEAAGFPWAIPDPGMEEMLTRMEKFKGRFGHTRVPARWKEDRALGRWLAHQRELYRWGKLRADLAWRLAALGVEWSIREPRIDEDDYMEKMLRRLAACRRRRGSLVVNCKADAALWCWIERQRASRKAGTMTVQRLERLEAAGFPWARIIQRMDDQFGRLAGFKARFGHTLVPARWPEDAPLGRWVAHQRELQRAGTLPPERRLQLDELGFEWVVSERPETRSRT